MNHCIIIHNSQDMETTYPQISIHRWMDKENVHPRVKYYSALKKEGNSAKHIINEPGEHYGKQNNLVNRKTNTASFHFISTVDKIIENTVIARD